jgi:chemotaxis regulatin CheY-phosphate phosphatase CheZ
MAFLGHFFFINHDIVDSIHKETNQMTYGEWHKQMMEQIQMDKLFELLEKQHQLLNEIKTPKYEQEEE